jgi:hypothetical protein
MLVLNFLGEFRPTIRGKVGRHVLVLFSSNPLNFKNLDPHCQRTISLLIRAQVDDDGGGVLDCGGGGAPPNHHDAHDDSMNDPT